MPRRDEPARLQRLQCVAKNRPRHVEPRRQLALAGQPVADPQHAFQDQPLDLLDHLVGAAKVLYPGKDVAQANPPTRVSRPPHFRGLGLGGQFVCPLRPYTRNNAFPSASRAGKSGSPHPRRPLDVRTRRRCRSPTRRRSPGAARSSPTARHRAGRGRDRQRDRAARLRERRADRLPPAAAGRGAAGDHATRCRASCATATRAHQGRAARRRHLAVRRRPAARRRRAPRHGRFNRILDIDYANRCVVAQPGVTNLGITNAVRARGLLLRARIRPARSPARSAATSPRTRAACTA